MNTFIKNILLLVVALILSYFTAEYFGAIYTFLFGSGNVWIGSEESWNFIIGLPLVLIFFVTITLGFKKLTLWLLAPLFLWEIIVDIRHIYLPIILALIAYVLALTIQKALKVGNR